MSNWSESEINILRVYGADLTSGEISNQHLPHRTPIAIKQACSRYGVIRRPPGKSNQRYSRNLGCFDSRSVEACYWAGFIAADGYLGKQANLQINLAIKDVEHLKRFSKFAGYDGPIGSQFKGDSEIARLNVYGVQPWLSALTKFYNIPPKGKTLLLTAPRELDELQSLAYTAGYIDGDGDICIASYKDTTYPSIRVCGTYAILCYFKELLDKHTSFKRKNSVVRTKENLSYYCVSGDRAVQVYQLISALNLPLLKRKWGRIEQWLEDHSAALSPSDVEKVLEYLTGTQRELSGA